MIPPLAAFIATADEQGDRELLERVLVQTRASAADPLLDLASSLPAVEHLPPLRLRALVPDRPGRSLISELLDCLTPERLVPGRKSPADGLSVKAGLYLIHDYLDASHELAQEADKAGGNMTAAYWHGIMHRREPDYDNARYWFRCVGQHAIFPVIGEEIAKLMAQPGVADHLRFDRLVDRRGHWDAMAFIDLCEQCGTRWDERARAAAQFQSIEIRVLLEYTCRAAMA